MIKFAMLVDNGRGDTYCIADLVAFRLLTIDDIKRGIRQKGHRVVAIYRAKEQRKRVDWDDRCVYDV